MKINSLTKDEALRALVSTDEGLTEAEAVKRLSESGPNEIRETRKKSLIIRALHQITHFLAILLWTAAMLSFLSEYLHPGEGMMPLGLAIIGVIMINAVFTFVQEYRAEKAIEALKMLLPFFVKVIRDGMEKEVPSREIVPGDIIYLSEGDRVPADSRLIESSLLRVNNASLTGESETLNRDSLPAEGELLESPNIVFAGTTITSGSGKALVFATGMGTEFGRIAHLTIAVEAGPSPLQQEIIRMTRLIAVLSTLMGIVFFAAGQVIGRGFWESFLFAVGIIVANVPEGLLPTVTLSLAMGSQRMAKRRALIKTLTSVETLGSVSVICTDKTGTITQNNMTVAKIWHGFTVLDAREFTGSSSDPLLRAVRFCNNSKVIGNQYRGDPTEIALLRFAIDKAGDMQGERIMEIPFDSDRKMMTTLHAIDGLKLSFTKGAMESVLPLCTGLLNSGRTVALDEQIKKDALAAYHDLMDKGLRVLAFAFNDYSDQTPETQHLESGLIFLGLIGLEDPPRPEVPAALIKCRDAGIRVIMITGDGSRTAVAVAREIGLVNEKPLVVEGSELAEMTDRQLREKLSSEEIIFSRMAPKHKMRVVTVLKEEGKRVAVTGDGVNDAPALKKADIGIAMGLTGTDVAKEAADMILLDDNFATIVNAVEEGRAVYENIRKFMTYILSSNIPEIVPYLLFILLKIPLPLTIMQILAVDLGTDMLPALALGAEKPTPDLMKKPPRAPGERLLNRGLLGRAYLFLGPIEAAAGMFGFFFVLLSGGWQWKEPLAPDNSLYIQATTACLTAIIITQAANVFACRSAQRSVFVPGFFSNRLIFSGIAFEFALQFFIVYHPWGNKIFSTAPVPIVVWLVLIPYALLLLGADEARKAIVGRRRQRCSS
jgi:sodium/potassium-transporting ATPase subunit alpha